MAKGWPFYNASVCQHLNVTAQPRPTHFNPGIGPPGAGASSGRAQHTDHGDQLQSTSAVPLGDRGLSADAVVVLFSGEHQLWAGVYCYLSGPIVDELHDMVETAAERRNHVGPTPALRFGQFSWAGFGPRSSNAIRAAIFGSNQSIMDPPAVAKRPTYGSCA